jgi:hypothetical protein
MYVSPKHPDREKLLARQKASPPEEQGRRLATFPRGPGGELRVTLSEYQGRPFLMLKLWERGQDGQLWPTPGKGTCSVRIAELEGMIGALREAVELVGGLGSSGDAGAAGRFALGQPSGQRSRNDDLPPRGRQRRGRDLASTENLPAAPGIGSGPPQDDL